MFSSLPADAAGMMRDDANLSMARQSLLEALEKTKIERRQLSRRWTVWALLFSPSRRRSHRQEMRSLGKQIRLLTSLLSRVQYMHGRLLPSVRAALVQHLGIIDPAYRQGVRASRYHEHWTRYHSILTERLTGFQRDLKEARAALIHDIKLGRPKISAHGQWCLSQAHAAAADLERTISDLHKTASLFEAMVDETPFVEVRMPKMEPWNCISPLFRAAEKSPTEALKDVIALCHDFSENKPAMLSTIKTLYRESTAMHSALAEDRLSSSWSELRRYAETYLIYPGEIEDIINDIENRQNEAERARHLRLMKPSVFVSSA